MPVNALGCGEETSVCRRLCCYLFAQAGVRAFVDTWECSILSIFVIFSGRVSQTLTKFRHTYHSQGLRRMLFDILWLTSSTKVLPATNRARGLDMSVLPSHPHPLISLPPSPLCAIYFFSFDRPLCGCCAHVPSLAYVWGDIWGLVFWRRYVCTAVCCTCGKLWENSAPSCVRAAAGFIHRPWEARHSDRRPRCPSP